MCRCDDSEHWTRLSHQMFRTIRTENHFTLPNKRSTSFQANRFRRQQLCIDLSNLVDFIMDAERRVGVIQSAKRKRPERIINYGANRRAFGLFVYFEWLFSIKNQSKPQSSLSRFLLSFSPLLLRIDVIFSCVSDSRKVHSIIDHSVMTPVSEAIFS